MSINVVEIDFSRPYVEVFGHDPTVHHQYAQDGKFYNQAGVEVHRKDGSLVSPAEKIARAKQQIKINAMKREEEIKRQILKYQKQEEELRKEELKLKVEVSAKNIFRLENPLPSYKTKEDIKGALDLLEFGYEEDEKRDALFEYLEMIYNAAIA